MYNILLFFGNVYSILEGLFCEERSMVEGGLQIFLAPEQVPRLPQGKNQQAIAKLIAFLLDQQRDPAQWPGDIRGQQGPDSKNEINQQRTDVMALLQQYQDNLSIPWHIRIKNMLEQLLRGTTSTSGSPHREHIAAAIIALFKKEPITAGDSVGFKPLPLAKMHTFFKISRGLTRLPEGELLLGGTGRIDETALGQREIRLFALQLLYLMLENPSSLSVSYSLNLPISMTNSIIASGARINEGTLQEDIVSILGHVPMMLELPEVSMGSGLPTIDFERSYKVEDIATAVCGLLSQCHKQTVIAFDDVGSDELSYKRMAEIGAAIKKESQSGEHRIDMSRLVIKFDRMIGTKEGSKKQNNAFKNAVAEVLDSMRAYRNAEEGSKKQERDKQINNACLGKKEEVGALLVLLQIIAQHNIRVVFEGSEPLGSSYGQKPD